MLSTQYRLRLESICKAIASGTEVSMEDNATNNMYRLLSCKSNLCCVSLDMLHEAHMDMLPYDLDLVWLTYPCFHTWVPYHYHEQEVCLLEHANHIRSYSKIIFSCMMVRNYLTQLDGKKSIFKCDIPDFNII